MDAVEQVIVSDHVGGDHACIVSGGVAVMGGRSGGGGRSPLCHEFWGASCFARYGHRGKLGIKMPRSNGVSHGGAKIRVMLNLAIDRPLNQKSRNTPDLVVVSEPARYISLRQLGVHRRNQRLDV